jgi:plasmid stabilization system protein ParE
LIFYHRTTTFYRKETFLRHSALNVYQSWKYPDRFPYRVIYEVVEAGQTVIVAAVLHAARHDRHWQSRV